MSSTTVDSQTCTGSLLHRDCNQNCYATKNNRYLDEINKKFAEAAATDAETAAESKAKEIVQFLINCMQQ